MTYDKQNVSQLLENIDLFLIFKPLFSLAVVTLHFILVNFDLWFEMLVLFSRFFLYFHCSIIIVLQSKQQFQFFLSCPALRICRYTIRIVHSAVIFIFYSLFFSWKKLSIFLSRSLLNWIKLDSVHDQWVLRVFADSQVLNFGTKYFWWCSKSVLRFQAKILHRSWVCIVWCELRTNGRRMKKQMKYVWHKCAHAWKNGMSFCYFIFLRVAFSHWIFYIKKCDRSSSYWSFDWIDCHTLGSIVALFADHRLHTKNKLKIICGHAHFGNERKTKTISKNNSAHFSIFTKEFLFMISLFTITHRRKWPLQMNQIVSYARAVW